MRSRAVLAAVLALALALRLWGIEWGLPDRWHYFGLHPDETLILGYALPDLGGLNLGAGKFLPGYYNYGSLPFYLDNFVYLLGSAYHLIGPIAPHGAIDPAAFARAYLAARFLTVAMGVGTVWAVYAVGRRLWSEGAGLLAALLLAVMPLHAQHSHFATVDVGAAFWLALSLVFCARVLQESGRAAIRDAALAGAFAGLSAATKYSGALVLLSLAAAVVVASRAGRIRPAAAWLCLVAGAASAAAAFAIACPGSILQTGLFVAGIRYESSHVMRHGEIYFAGGPPGWIYIVERNLDAGLGLPLLLLCVAGCAYAVVRRSAGDGLLAAFALPTYLLLGAAQSRYARYEIALLPPLALWAGRAAVDAFAPAAGARLRRGASVGAFAAIAVFTLADCVVLLWPMTQTDPRVRSAEWLARHAPAPAAIGFSGAPWFWSPAIDPYFAAAVPGAWRSPSLTPPAQLARYCYNPQVALDPGTLESCRAPFVVLTEYQYYDPLRLHQTRALTYLRDLRREYRPPIVFADVHPIGGRRTLDGLRVQDLPTDMLYPSPTILIYVRR